MITARGLAVAGVCLLLSAVLVARTPRALSGQEVSGVYAIQEVEATSAVNVRVTLHVVLSSSTDATLESKSVSLRSVLSSTTQTLSASFTIPAHGNADFTAKALYQRRGIQIVAGGRKALAGAGSSSS